MADFEVEFARRNALSHALAMTPCLHDQFIEMRETAEASLIFHLPSVHPEDRGWIRAEEVQALLNAISTSRVNLSIAILQALKHIGDRQAIPYVEGLFSQIESDGDADARRLRAAAYDCLLCLRDAAARARQSESLLRGSQDPCGSSRTILLRPADASNMTAAAELLRPGQADK